MLHIKTTIMTSLREKIQESMNMLIMLMEMTTLDDEHLALNMLTVNWLNKMDDVFEENGLKFEQKKFELEERMKAEIQNLTDQIENMFPRCD